MWWPNRIWRSLFPNALRLIGDPQTCWGAAEDRFYRDLLGFRMYWHGGFKDAGDDWWEIQVPDGTDWIEYMLNIPAKADAKERGVQNHFSLGVDKIQSAASQLHQNGLENWTDRNLGATASGASKHGFD